MIKSIINWFRNNLNINRENIFFSYDLTLWFHNFNSDFDPKNLRNEGSCNWLFCSPWKVDSENEIKNPFFGVAQLEGDTLKAFCRYCPAYTNKIPSTNAIQRLRFDFLYHALIEERDPIFALSCLNSTF